MLFQEKICNIMYINDKNKISITDKYSHEINTIYNKLLDLQRGKIYELYHTPGYPSYSTIATQLKDDLDQLLIKIQNNDESLKETIDKYRTKI